MKTRMKSAVIPMAILSVTLLGCDTSDTIDSAPPPAEETTANMEARKAGVGVGKQGSAMRGDDSLAAKMVTSSARAYFDTKEKIVFEIQLPQAMQLYKAQDNFGKGPQSHEEYMQKIVKANNIPLPKLPEGMQYVYKPDIEELWVEPIAQSDAPKP